MFIPPPTKKKQVSFCSLETALFVAAMIGGALGCGKRAKDLDPVSVVKKLVDAVSRGDAKAIQGLLGPRTRSRLEEYARKANAQTAGRLKLKPLDLLSVAGRNPPTGFWVPTRFELVQKTGAESFVEVSAPAVRHQKVEAGPVKLILTASMPEGIGVSPRPIFQIRRAFPFAGFDAAVYLFPAGSRVTLELDRRVRVRLVRHRDRWKVELDLEEGKDREEAGKRSEP